MPEDDLEERLRSLQRFMEEVPESIDETVQAPYSALKSENEMLRAEIEILRRLGGIRTPEETRELSKFYFGRAFAKYDKKDLDGAIADCSKAIELDPNYAAAYNNRGNAKKDRGDLDGAIADYDKAIELSPKYTAAYNNRGLVWNKLGQPEKAKQDFEMYEKLRLENSR